MQSRKSDKRQQGLVEFSTSQIELVNDGSEQQRQVYQLQNRSPSSLRVRAAIAKDSDPVFSLLSGNVEKYLAPGLKLPVVLQYSPRDGSSHRGCLEVYTNNDLILTVSITALPPSPKLHLERDIVDFGTLVTDHQIQTTTFHLSNHGNQSGSFFIDISPLPAWVSLHPVRGRLEPDESTDIQIEVLCKEEREFSYDLSIHSTEQGVSSDVTGGDVTPPLTVTLCGRLQRRALRLLEPHTHTPLDCVTFDPTYYDTETSRQVILYNDSPVATEFLCLLDSSAEGSEAGVSGREGVAMACTEGGPGQGRWREQGDAPTAERLLRVDPAQDSLLPYEKRPVELTFAPTFLPSGSGWDHFQATPTRRDYALYLRFMAVGTNKDTSSADLEVAVGACALPVDILLEPDTLQFGACPTMQTCTQELKIHNNSDALPLQFYIHRLPHYTYHPPTGHIPPSHTHTLSVTFTPKQLGPLNSKLMVDILAPKPKSLPSTEATKPGIVKTLAVEVRGDGVVGEKGGGRDGVGRKMTTQAHPDDLATSIRPYDGSRVITPYTHTPRYTYVDRDYAYSDQERQQHQQHRDYYLHYLRNSQAHRQWRKREKALSNAMRGPEKELGMLALEAPGNSPTVTGSPTKKIKKAACAAGRERGGKKGERSRGGGGGGGMMTTDDLRTATSVELREVELCSSKPDCVQVASETALQLSPHQLSLITINPGILDYGLIAVGSAVDKTLTVKNSLNQHISVAFKLAGSGLQYPLSLSSPSLTVILPPSSFTRLPLTMYRSTQGLLERCVECCVNGHHINRLPVRVEAVPLSLTLSTHTLTLTQPRMATPMAGLRGYLEVSNAHNIPAAFQWHAREGVDTTTFFMVHPTGIVPAHSSLRCEFVCMPSHDSPESALFRLMVVDDKVPGGGGGGGGGGRGRVPGGGGEGVSGSGGGGGVPGGERGGGVPGGGGGEGVPGGEEGVPGGGGGGVPGGRSGVQRVDDDNFLTLRAELGHPVCSFREQRVLFGAVPLGLTTTQTVHLQNTGECHAYFQVMNPEPCPGLRVHPESGCVPVGGASDLKLHLHPDSVAVFDTELVVCIRGGRKLALKVVGAAEKPTITINRESFNFGGVYCGSKSSLPFTVSNTGSTRCELMFDFSFLSDFSLILPQPSSPYAEVVSENPSADMPGIYTLLLPAKTSTQCQLILSPNDVAAYDFQLPVLVNGARPPSPPPSPWPPSPLHSSNISMKPHQQGRRAVLGSYETTPCRRVLATAVRAPLSLSISHFSFSFPVGFLETTTEPVLHPQTAELMNVGDSPLTWTLMTSGISRVEDGTFRLVLPTGSPLPLPPVNIGPPGEGEVGYLAPQESCKFSVHCSPSHHGEFLADIPLLLNGNTAQHYSTLTLSASVPVGKITMSTKCIVLQPVPLDITITAQYTLTVQDFPGAVDIEAVIPSVSDCASLVVRFPDGGHVDECRQTAVDLPVVLEFTSSQPITLAGYLVFCDTNTRKKVRVAYAVAADNSLPSVAQFLAQSVAISSVQLNTQQVPMLNVSSPGGTVVSTSSSISLTASQATRELSCTPLSSSLTGDASYSDLFMQECVSAVCRWVSCYGWAHGVRHITSPTDLRERVGHDVPKRGVKQRSSIKVHRGLLVELVSHICGRLPPGIPTNPPPCTTPSEKINQQYSTLTTILTFLKTQGGELWSLTPDSLLDYRDYQQWLLDSHPSLSLLPPARTEEEFQERSGQAWTYLLLQIMKVLVLPRVTNQVPSYLRSSVSQLDSQPCSNVYSVPERVILAWLNYHYTQQRSAVLKCDDEYVREVVSYDMDLMDCTVLACVLSAYCPFLVSSHFTALYAQPSSAEQCSHNALILMDALTHIGINYDCQASDLITPTPVFLLLLCCHLYQILPSLSPSPSRTVLFEGLLHSNIRQQITLDNPSSKPLTYTALLRGENASKFSIVGGSDIFAIPARKSASIEIGYRGHQIQPCDAVLLLMAMSGCGISGTSVAFRLQGQVTGAEPQSRVQVSAALYQVQTVRVQVTSSFQAAGQFDVYLYESTDTSLLSTLSPSTRRKTATRSLGVIPATAFQNRSTDKRTAFNPHANQLYLEPGLPTTLILTFVPLKMEPRHCAIILQNNDLGELVISIKASVKLPFPTLPKTSSINSHFFVNSDTRTLHLKAYAGETVREDLILPSENTSLERAMLEVCQWGMSEVELRRRTLTNSLKQAALTTAMECLGLEKKTMTATDNMHQDLDKLVFRVDGTDKTFLLPESIAVPASGGGVVQFPVQFHAEEPGQYECRVMLTSAHDVRVFIIESTVMARGRYAELEFTTTAMQPLTQDIPLVNPSTVEWPLQATLRGTGFSGPDSLLSQPLSTTCYPLTFNPKKEGQVEGELRLVNANDGTEHTFVLRGVAEKPLAQSHIVLHTQAKTSLTHILHVPNYNERTTEFRVESDLECVSGPSTISIAGGDLVDYPLLVKPIRRGVISGALAFVAQTPSTRDRRTLSTPCTQRGGTPHHVWFQLEVTVDPSPPDQVIPVTCPTLSSTITHLPITNTLSQPLQLSVMVGGASISGPDILEVEANTISTYPLTFAPTLNGKTIGQVVFDGGPDGEFWYQLELSADDPAPVTLPELNCELGKTIQVTVPLSNPLDHSVLFACECSNTQHFIIPGLTVSQVEVEAGGSVEVCVLFKPSCVGLGEHLAHISFTSLEFGTQVFILQGQGSEPSTMEPTTIQASLNSNTTHVITFTNLLDITAHFRVALQDGRSSEHFCLLMKRTHGIFLHPGVSLDIPIMFAPEAMHIHKTTVIVSTEGRGEMGSGGRLSLAWRYPIIGEPEFRPISPESAPRIACQAKERVEERLEVVLVGCKMSKAMTFRPVTPSLENPMSPIVSPSNESDNYSYQLVCSDNEYSSLVMNCVGVKLLRKIASKEDPIKLVFGIVFVPPKAFSCIAELNVSGGDGGGVWKFPLHLSAATASPDDVIVLEAAGLNKESQIQFRLTSLQEHPLPFTAYLTQDSDPDITVSPASGELAPVNSKGTLFFLTYKPKTYGRDHKAKLVVQCESNEWCYEIVGKLTQYSPPKHTPSRVQHRAMAPLVLSQTKKNFIHENMKLCTSILPV